LIFGESARGLLAEADDDLKFDKVRLEGEEEERASGFVSWSDLDDAIDE